MGLSRSGVDLVLVAVSALGVGALVYLASGQDPALAIIGAVGAASLGLAGASWWHGQPRLSFGFKRVHRAPGDIGTFLIVGVVNQHGVSVRIEDAVLAADRDGRESVADWSSLYPSAASLPITLEPGQPCDLWMTEAGWRKASTWPTVWVVATDSRGQRHAGRIVLPPGLADAPDA